MKKNKLVLFNLLVIFAMVALISSCEQAATETLKDVQNVVDATDDIEDRNPFYFNYYGGDSHIYWPFANSSYISGSWGTNNWRVTCGPNCGWHHGADYYADDWANGTCGTDFKAPIEGTVIFAGYVHWGYGNQVIIQAGNFAFRVAHLESIGNVWKGQYIYAGQVIGKVGTTGNSTGCHAHCVLYKNIYESYNNSWQTGVWRLEQGYGLGSGTSGGPNKFAAPYYFDAGNKSIRIPDDKGIITKQDDLDGKPSCGHVHDTEVHTTETLQQKMILAK